MLENAAQDFVVACDKHGTVLSQFWPPETDESGRILPALWVFPDIMVDSPTQVLATLWNKGIGQAFDTITPSHSLPADGAWKAIWVYGGAPTTKWWWCQP